MQQRKLFDDEGGVVSFWAEARYNKQVEEREQGDCDKKGKQEKEVAKPGPRGAQCLGESISNFGQTNPDAGQQQAAGILKERLAAAAIRDVRIRETEVTGDGTSNCIDDAEYRRREWMSCEADAIELCYRMVQVHSIIVKCLCCDAVGA